jgi:hypothetical protein
MAQATREPPPVFGNWFAAGRAASAAATLACDGGGALFGAVAAEAGTAVVVVGVAVAGATVAFGIVDVVVVGGAAVVVVGRPQSVGLSSQLPQAPAGDAVAIATPRTIPTTERPRRCERTN